VGDGAPASASSARGFAARTDLAATLGRGLGIADGSGLLADGDVGAEARTSVFSSAALTDGVGGALRTELATEVAPDVTAVVFSSCARAAGTPGAFGNVDFTERKASITASVIPAEAMMPFPQAEVSWRRDRVGWGRSSGARFTIGVGVVDARRGAEVSPLGGMN